MVEKSKKLPLSKKKFLTYICKALKNGHNQVEIAKKLKTSKQRINYWVKRLEASGFILRDYRTSQVFYHVYLKELKNYFFEQEVKKKDMGISLHFIKLRFPFFKKPSKEFDRVVLSERDGIKVDVNHESVIVWIPRFMVDRFARNRKNLIDNFAYAGIVAYPFAFKYAMKVDGEIRAEDVEFVSPIHIAKGVFADFSKGWLEIEKLVRWKTAYEKYDSDQERIDMYFG